MTPEASLRPAVRLNRLIPAAPGKVYRAWLEPDLLARWLAPGTMQVTRIEVDERVGGHYRVWQGTSDGDAGGFECQILELVPDERIVFKWGFVGPERTDGPTFDSLLTITLSEAPGNATDLTLVHERLDTLHAAMPHVAENVGPGWDLVLDRLTTTLGDR
jgi:uncharacterized protein YndB with AHSA1/START domain